MTHTRITFPGTGTLQVHECNIHDAWNIAETMADEDYLSVRLPRELMAEIDRLVDRKALGFRSRAEFIADATRRRLEEIIELEKGRGKRR